MLAITVAVIGVAILEYTVLARINEAFPPCRAGQLVCAENLLGGVMFGIGMTLASGCRNKCLIRIGVGNLKSIRVMLVIGGVLAMGCTIGQAVTGISTLALGSFITFFRHPVRQCDDHEGDVLRLVYEDEATCGKAPVTALADMHLLPDGLRRLDKV